MQLQRYVDALKADLTAVAELGDDATAQAASRLVVSLQASIGLRLLDALSAAAAEDGHTARISLRLPETLKTAVESAAAREGVSVNTWIVRALTRSTTSGTTMQSGNRLQG